MDKYDKNSSALKSDSEIVREFYERYPYPGPVEDLDKYKILWKDDKRRRADYHLFWPDREYKDNFSILIAGCGTSQAAKYAIRWPEANITGIDFSMNSIDCTIKLKEKYKLNNLNVLQLEIENVKDLGMNFDQIICTGVLHHLPDPDAGLKALREVLKPEGAMHLMLYAPYGRTGIYMIQEYCRLLGISSDEEGISDLIFSLKALPPGHPLEILIRNAPDFQKEGALADALLNPQDRAYSVPQVFEFLKRGEMKFGRWIRQAPYSPLCGVMSQIPQTKILERLSSEEQFATAELFRGTMVRHSFIAYRSDYPGSPDRNVSFNPDDNSWTGYIPVRFKDTLCIEEQVPKGSVAILISKTQYRDIYMPVDSNEKILFNAIDGIKSIGEIIEKILPTSDKTSRMEISRKFFERLWWYDQAVFDKSKHGSLAKEK